MRARLLPVFAIVLAMLAAAAPPPATTVADPGTLAESDCSRLAAPGSDPRPLLGRIACGSIEVPEDWDRPDGRRLSISWVVLRADSRVPAPDPVVYLAGGPGGSALGEILTYSQLFAPLRKERDIVLFDQRGAAFSTPLRCSNWTMDQLLALSVEGLLAPAEQAAAAPVLPAAADARALLEAARKELGPASERCARQFAEAGIDLARYTSAASARDTIALVEALGYDTFNLYGISYGTRLALTIARDFPDSGIRSMVLDSVFPPQIDGFEQYPALLPEAAAQVFADCRRDPACNGWYPGLAARFAALLPSLDANPPRSSLGPVTSAVVVATMADLTVNVEAAPYIPRMVAELERGETETWEAIATGRILGYAPRPAGDGAEGTTGAGTIDDVRAEIVLLAASLAAGEDPVSPSTQRFLDTLSGEFAALPGDRAADFALRTIFLSRLPHTRDTLEEFIRRSFPGRQSAKANLALQRDIAGMTDDDIAALFARLQAGTDALDPYTWSLNPHLFSSVACNEEIPFEQLEVAVEVARAQAIPELAAPGLGESAAQFAICEEWPSPAAEAIENEPVRSDVPVLLLAGSYDAQTPVSWAKTAFVTLPNAVFVQLPMSGHGALQYSGCAEKIVRSYLNAPGLDPALACVAALRPRFQPPDGPLALPAPAATPRP